MTVHYTKHRDVKKSSLIDGYGSVNGMEGPFRDNQNKVVYYDPLQGKYLSAKEVHRYAAVN